MGAIVTGSSSYGVVGDSDGENAGRCFRGKRIGKAFRKNLYTAVKLPEITLEEPTKRRSELVIYQAWQQI